MQNFKRPEAGMPQLYDQNELLYSMRANEVSDLVNPRLIEQKTASELYGKNLDAT